MARKTTPPRFGRWAWGLVVVWLTGCQLLQTNRPANPAAAYGVQRESALFLSGGQPDTLDPATAHSSAGGIVGHLFNGLVMLTPTLQVTPDLAAGWEVSADGRSYTFYLHPAARFHDGRPVTAADVIFSWERAIHPTTQSDTALAYLRDIEGAEDMAAGRSDHIRGLQALNDLTLVVQIDAPKSYFLAKLTYPATFIVDRFNVTQAGWERRPNGAGPFQLHTWEDDEILILARHELYHQQPPQPAHVVYLLGADLPLALYETGVIDVVGVGGETLARARDPGNPFFQELRTLPSWCTTYLGFNSRVVPFDNPQVRLAFNLALDRDRLIEALYRGEALPAHSILPPGMPGYQPRPGYAYAPDEARALLAEAGYDPLPTLTLLAAGFQEADPLSTAVITLWQEVLGVEIEVELVEPYTYLDELYAGRMGHLFLSGWCADYPDPENFLDVLFHSQSSQNLGGYRNLEIDALLETARSEPDVGRRLALYQEAETRLLADAPAALIAHGLTSVMVKPRVQGYVLTPIGVTQWQNITLVEP